MEMARCTLIMTFSLTENGYCTPFPWLPVRGLTFFSGDFGSSYEKHKFQKGKTVTPLSCRIITKNYYTIAFNREIVPWQVVKTQARQVKKEVLDSTFSGNFNPPMSTCSPISLLRFASRKDPECNCLIRSSRLKAAAAALKAVTRAHANKSHADP